eukprot:scaffold400_cov100-Skeletonema_dohrnii-CCMP3373.AAC.4
MRVETEFGSYKALVVVAYQAHCSNANTSTLASIRALRADNFASDRVLHVPDDIPFLLSAPILVYICMASANGPWLRNWDDNGITVYDHSHLSGLMHSTSYIDRVE